LVNVAARRTATSAAVIAAIGTTVLAIAHPIPGRIH